MWEKHTRSSLCPVWAKRMVVCTSAGAWRGVTQSWSLPGVRLLAINPTLVVFVGKIPGRPSLAGSGQSWSSPETLPDLPATWRWTIAVLLSHLFPAPQGGGKKSVVWRDAEGKKVTTEGRYRLEGTDLVIERAGWSDMGRWASSPCLSCPYISYQGSPAPHKMDLEWTWCPAFCILFPPHFNSIKQLCWNYCTINIPDLMIKKR